MARRKAPALYPPARSTRAFLHLEFPMKKAVRITGTMGVIVPEYVGFDSAHPEKTEFKSFAKVDLDADGKVSGHWAGQGYVQVGTAKVEIEFMQRDEITSGAVVALRKQKNEVLAQAQKQATEIEKKIQSLLAITNEVTS